MRILLIGAKGLLGQALGGAFSAEDLVAVDRDVIDITDKVAIQKFCREAGPEVIINAAAYNAVDEIERNAEAEATAFAVNAAAVGYLAEAAVNHQALLVHFSTDYVFDGAKGSFYVEDDSPGPISIYGRSKYEGEQAIIKYGRRGLKYYLIRTSRLFGKTSAGGKKTFVDIVLEAASQKDTLQFIDDEIASPTFVGDLAPAVREIIAKRPASGIYHRTNDGGCSWYEFAKIVLDESGIYSTIAGQEGRRYIQLRPTTSRELPRPARRPAYSVLQSTKLPPLRHWREALRTHL
jgi:dTDP-4-dehydrorhamnose reductase